MNLVPGETVLKERVTPIRQALFSCYDNTEIPEFAQFLHQQGAEIISSTGTAEKIAGFGVPVIDVGDLTGYPPLFGHRIATLHPAIHGGILMDEEDPQHQVDAKCYGIEPIDLVCVFLYPFGDALEQGLTPDEMIEYVDIGGPALLRAAAKNFKRVTVISHRDDLQEVANSIMEHGGVTTNIRLQNAWKVFYLTMDYDTAIEEYLYGFETRFPPLDDEESEGN